MENIRPFQIALLAGFAFLGVLSLILIANFGGFSSSENNIYGDSVEIWGTIDAEVVNDYLEFMSDEIDGFDVVTYREFDKLNFESEFTNALAEGRGPDLVILSSNMLVSLRNKLLPVPYETFSLRNFRNFYIDGAEIFTQSDGIYAIPFAVDPLVMYWNRDLFAASGLVEPPETWEVFVNKTVPSLNKRDSVRNLAQSAVALGGYENINNAIPIIITLAMQAGSKIVVSTEDQYLVQLDVSEDQNTPPFTTAMQFYLDFSNRNSSRYSWNTSKQLDYTTFLGQRLAIYFGLASELSDIQNGNPNLNFDVTTVPQGSGSVVKRTYGEYYGFALVRASDNVNGAYAAMQVLTEDNLAANLSMSLGLSPVTRSILSSGSDDIFQSVFFEAASIAYGWLNPSPSASSDVFRGFVTDVTSNRQELDDAVSRLVNRLTQTF